MVGDDPGDGTARGTCPQFQLCEADGTCKPGTFYQLFINSNIFCFKCKIIHCLANIPIEFSVATTMATTSKTITENTIETSITEATTTPPSHNTTATPATANETESTATASSEISTRTTGNAKANLSTSSAARGIQGRSGVGLIIAILLAPMVLFEK